MDSMDLEREKGITILAKNNRGPLERRRRPGRRGQGQHHRHARPRGLRRRGRARPDHGRRRPAARRRLGGPAAADALRAAQGAGVQAAGDPRRQQGRPARRPDLRGGRRGLRAVPRPRRRRDADRVPDRLRQREGRPRRHRPRRARRGPRAADDDDPRAHPPPSYEEGHPLQAHVTNLDASPYVGRLALCRVRQGHIRKGQQVAWCRTDGSVQRATVAELYVTEALDRVDAEEAGPGEIIAVAGLAEVTIGETLADPEDPRPLRSSASTSPRSR